MIKDTDEQADEEICRVRSGRAVCVGASVPMELGGVILLAGGSVHPLGSSHAIRILWRLPHVGMINYKLHFQLLSRLWRSGGWGRLKIPSF